jgi:hypothetical protein
MLVSAEKMPSSQRRDDVVAAFLAFLAKEMIRDPHTIAPLAESVIRRMDALAEGVSVSPDEDLGDEALL